MRENVAKDAPILLSVSEYERKRRDHSAKDPAMSTTDATMSAE